MALLYAIHFITNHNLKLKVGPQAAGRSEAGQATVEYVVVVLAASLLAGLFIRWVNGTGKIGELLDRVIDTVIGSV